MSLMLKSGFIRMVLLFRVILMKTQLGTCKKIIYPEKKNPSVT